MPRASASRSASCPSPDSRIEIVDTTVEKDYKKQVLTGCEGAHCLASTSLIGYGAYRVYRMGKEVKAIRPFHPVVAGGVVPFRGTGGVHSTGRGGPDPTCFFDPKDRTTVNEHEGETNRTFKRFLTMARYAGVYRRDRSHRQGQSARRSAQMVRKPEEKEIVIRPYRPGDEEGMNALYNRIFEKRRSLQGWRAKFIGFGPTPRVIAAVAEQGGEIIGMYPALVSYFQVGDKEVLFGLPVEVGVDPEHRSSGLVSALKRCARQLGIEAGVVIGLGFPTRSHSRIGRRYLGYRRLGTFPVWTRDYRGALERISRGPFRVGRKALAILLTLYRREKLMAARWKTEWSQSIRIRAVTAFDETFKDLWDEVKAEGKIMRVRTPDYLNWKYFGNPEERFRVYAAVRQGKPRGYIAVTVKVEHKQRVGYIYDFFAIEQGGVTRALVCKGLSHLLSQGIDLGKCGVVGSTALCRQLVDLKFRPSREDGSVICEMMIEGVDLDRTASLDNWYVTMAETDWLGW